MKRLKTLATAAAMVATAGSVQAALIYRGDGMIYDTTRNITWLSDMNYARTSAHTGSGVWPNGQMTWAAATDWAANLVYGGFNDWRLPTLSTLDVSCGSTFPAGDGSVGYYGLNCSGSELGGLFVTELGYNNNGTGLITADDTAQQIANLALFSNIPRSGGYWGRNLGYSSPGETWLFTTHFGAQAPSDFSSSAYAVAVRSGDVLAVPEPQTLALVLMALGVAAAARRRVSA